MGVLEDAKAWQLGPLDRLYPIVCLDAMVIKICDATRSQTAPATWRSASTSQGERDVLRIWFQRAEGVKFWMQVLTELRPPASGRTSIRP